MRECVLCIGCVSVLYRYSIQGTMIVDVVFYLFLQKQKKGEDGPSDGGVVGEGAEEPE